MVELALFPLKTVLLPGNLLSLKIFEPRYLDMIANCMRNESAFGVVLIFEGEETGAEAEFYSIGTTAIIQDWQNRADGLLGISALGQQRFEIKSTHVQSDKLTIGEITLLDEQPSTKVPEQFFYMQELLEHISAQQGHLDKSALNFSDILYQLIYLLPLDTNLKQRLLEIPECHERAVILHAELIRIGVIQYLKPDDLSNE